MIMKRLKNLFKTGIFMLVLVIPLVVVAGCATYQGDISSTTGYTGPYNLDDLDNYGDWLYLAPYGEVWRPYVVLDWMPFDNGYWAYSNDAWTWISYEPFGWIVYHYGYWFDDQIYGWVWIPSDDPWSPARVEWVDYGDYVGWAPLPPPGIRYGDPWELDNRHYWNVVRQQDFTRDNIRDYRIVNPLRDEMGGRSVLNAPPDRSTIESATGGRINSVNIQRERVQLPPREIERMNLPPAESRKVEQRAPEVRRRDLVPREEYHNQHPERSQGHEKENRRK
jgi:hypothetical protein